MGVLDGLDGDAGDSPAMGVRVSRYRSRQLHTGRESYDRLAPVQPVLEVPLIRRPVRGQTEVLGPSELGVGGAEFEDLVDTVGAWPRTRDDVPAPRLEHQPVRLQPPFHIAGFGPAAVADVQHPAVPHRLRHRREERRLLGLCVPPWRVEVKASADPVRVGPQFGRQRGPHLQLGSREERAQTQLGGGPRSAA